MWVPWRESIFMCVYTKGERTTLWCLHKEREREQVSVVYFIIFVFVFLSEHFSIFFFFWALHVFKLDCVSSSNNKFLDIKLTRAPLSSSSFKLNFVFFLSLLLSLPCQHHHHQNNSSLLILCCCMVPFVIAHIITKRSLQISSKLKIWV